MAALDGATIIDYQGNVLAAGAIVKLRGAGSPHGGARKAAAKTLGEYGLAIKVSSDGAITGFTLENGTMKEIFSVG
jgi:hypothetical protein